MQGLMQDRPLLISSLIEHAAHFHPHAEIVSRTVEGPVVRTDYATIERRARRAAQALARLGVGPSDRVGTLAWNTHRHLELYYAVSGMGAVLHTINPRLFPDQIRYIADHAEDRVLCFDIGFAPLIEKLAPHLPRVRHFVALTDRAHMPGIPGVELLCYEDLVAASDEGYVWPEFDERTASSLCYTSGTTGHPKGVLYSHRSTVIHSLAACSADALGLAVDSTILLVVPLFHANAWGVVYAAPMVGAKLVLPGPFLDGKSIYELMRDEKVNYAQGVPTVWLMLFAYLDEHPELDPRALALKRITVGGSAASVAMIERCHKLFGCALTQGWGMTEMSPLGVIGNLLPKHQALPLEEQFRVRAKQGRGMWGVELRIVDEEHRPLPWDGVAFGHLLVRGPWCASGYFKGEGGKVLDDDGFFDTGDVASIDPDGYVQLVDRAKDVIKSGGEWISSIDLENAAMGHPGIAEAAVIGVAHPKWQERPLLIAVRRPQSDVSREELLQFLEGRVAKWWLPDDVVFVTELPHTATGKLQKNKLRETYKDFVLT